MINRVIVAGGRDFADRDFLYQKLDHLLSQMEGEIIIVSGGASGADALGELYALERGLKKEVFRARWSELGKGAGPARNQEMAEHATHAVCFWDGRSRGTKDMISRAKKQGLKLRVVMYGDTKNYRD